MESDRANPLAHAGLAGDGFQRQRRRTLLADYAFGGI